MISPSPGTAISKIDYYRIMARDVSIAFAKYVLKKKKRTRGQVDKEYNSGSWKSVLDNRGWDKVSSLEQFLFNQKGQRVALIDGVPTRVNSSDYYRYRAEKIRSILREQSGEVTDVVELGSGTGTNILSLAGDPHWRTLHGFDISENGISAARAAAAKFSLNHVSFDFLDLLDARNLNWKKIEGKTVFTYFCLEQLPHAMSQVVENILRAKPFKVVHFETSWDLLEMNSLIDLSTRLHVLNADYQKTLTSELRKHAERGSLIIERSDKLNFAPGLYNVPTITVWRPSNELV